MLNGPYYIISDNHFSMINNSEEYERREKLFSVFNKIKEKGVGTLIIGGDFFDYWFEYKYEIPKGYESILTALKDLHNHNIKIHYIVGNHDYWDFGYLNQMTGLRIYKNDLIFKYNNQNILITHGDGILKSDYLYRFMKKIIRSKLFIYLFKLLPASLTCKLAKKISKSSSDYNHHDKYVDLIKKDTLEYAKKQWNKNIDIVCIGHYHQTGINIYDKNKLIYLGDWLSKYTVTVLNDNKCWQGDWKQFIDLS